MCLFYVKHDAAIRECFIVLRDGSNGRGYRARHMQILLLEQGAWCGYMGRGKGIFEGTPVVEMQRWQERTFPDQAPVRDTLPEPILRLNALAKEIQRERDELEILESKERNNFLVLNQICMWQLLQEYIQVQPSNPALVEQATVVIDLFKKRTRLDPFIGVVREVCNLKGKPFLAAELELVRRVKSSSSRISQVLSIILTKLASIIPKCTAAAIEGVCRPHMSECDGGPEDEPFKHPATALSKRKLVIFHTEVDTSDLRTLFSMWLLLLTRYKSG